VRLKVAKTVCDTYQRIAHITAAISIQFVAS
jgi:hypothetical protein